MGNEYEMQNVKNEGQQLRQSKLYQHICIYALIKTFFFLNYIILYVYNFFLNGLFFFLM